ncbi:MAG: sodium-dependent transporter [Fibrobacteraceae bacterium]|nr:sodium-dependent transporter [Fibrobacteraceae bacterium]
MNNRENFASRMGFLLVAAGCAIGIGNVWRFPFITGQSGGAAFVLIYLFFLVIFGLPILMMEFSVGRGSGFGIAKAFDTLEKPGHKWHYAKYPMLVGNYVLMMFYTSVSGWMFYYFYDMVAVGDLMGKTPEQVGAHFGNLLASPSQMVFWMSLATILGLGIVSLGLQKGVERITKWMMSALFIIMVALVVCVISLPGAGEGVKFYVLPDLDRLLEQGIWNVVFAALGQAFFTLSIGVGSMAIFGSYIKKDHSLPKEALNICLLDTLVAILAGFIVIPACFAFKLEPTQGPGLLFVTLPNVFNQMYGGRIFGGLFFLFLSFAALSTLIAVFENIVAFWIDIKHYPRKKVVLLNIVAVILLSLPCALGFNLLSGFQPFGEGSCVLDLEDFIISNTLLPLGAIVFVLFCTSRYGWGKDNFMKELNTGKGLKVSAKNKVLSVYFKYILPTIVLVVFLKGYYNKFFE